MTLLQTEIRTLTWQEEAQDNLFTYSPCLVKMFIIVHCGLSRVESRQLRRLKGHLAEFSGICCGGKAASKG